MHVFRKKQLIHLSVCLVFYLVAVVAYAVWSNNAFRAAAIHEIDQKLLLAAKSLKFMLAPDFHDRAVDADSISKAEELRNRDAISGFAFETDLEWLYTLVENDQKFFFAAPTVTADEAKDRERWYYLPYDDIPPTFVEAYQKKKTFFLEYEDQWGAFRSVVLPEISPGGRTYLACADYEISHLNAIFLKNQLSALFTAVYFLLCSLPLVLFIRSSYRSYSANLKAINVELSDHKQHLEELVSRRTAELEGANRQLQREIRSKTEAEEQKEQLIGELQKALAEVRSLSGLLPICSVCKKIRDDTGYWNQIETYISNHSEAYFSHGICPDCIREMYGDMERFRRPDTEKR